MADIDVLVARARRYLPSVPDITIETTAVDIYRRFCRDSEIWRVPLDSVTMRAGTRYFDASLLMPRHAMLYKILWMSVDNEPLEQMPSREIMLRDIANRGRPSAFVMYPGADLQIYPQPEKDVVITGAAVLQPKSGAEVIEDFIADDHLMTLVNGVVASILAMPQRGWYDPRSAGMYEQLFREGIEEARQHANAEDVPREYTMTYGGI